MDTSMSEERGNQTDEHHQPEASTVSSSRQEQCQLQQFHPQQGQRDTTGCWWPAGAPLTVAWGHPVAYFAPYAMPAGPVLGSACADVAPSSSAGPIFYTAPPGHYSLPQHVPPGSMIMYPIAPWPYVPRGPSVAAPSVPHPPARKHKWPHLPPDHTQPRLAERALRRRPLGRKAAGEAAPSASEQQDSGSSVPAAARTPAVLRSGRSSSCSGSSTCSSAGSSASSVTGGNSKGSGRGKGKGSGRGRGKGSRTAATASSQQRDTPDPMTCTSDSPEASTSASWGGVTTAILHNIVLKLMDSGVKQLRLVCRHWRQVVDHNLEALTPSELRTRSLVRLFPNLRTLHLTRCANIRNRDLALLAAAGLSLHTLTLGDSCSGSGGSGVGAGGAAGTARPWLTNVGLASIARITTLTSLNLHDCSGVTNNGMAALTGLRRLASLSVHGCSKLTAGALAPLGGLRGSLTSLSLHGCRVADKGLLALQGLQLVSLHLGNAKVHDEGLAHIARMTTLRELHFDQEDLSDAGVSQLTSLTRLESLALRDCADVSADSLSVLVPALPSLASLDLYKNYALDDVQLSRCLQFLGAVTFLDLRGTPVTDDGVQQLTKLTSLQKLCLAPTQEHLWSPYLCVVSNLTQLTSLSINNCTLISFGQLETLRQLKLLRELDLSHDSSKDESVEVASQQPANVTAVEAMAAITSLTSLDLSRRPMHEEHLSTLAERLPRLHTLIIVGCPLLQTEVQSLGRRFPELVIHHRPQLDVSCSSSSIG